MGIFFLKKDFFRILTIFDKFALRFIEFDILKLKELLQESTLIFDDIILDKSRSKIFNLLENNKIYKKILPYKLGKILI